MADHVETIIQIINMMTGSDVARVYNHCRDKLGINPGPGPGATPVVAERPKRGGSKKPWMLVVDHFDPSGDSLPKAVKGDFKYKKEDIPAGKLVVMGRSAGANRQYLLLRRTTDRSRKVYVWDSGFNSDITGFELLAESKVTPTGLPAELSHMEGRPLASIFEALHHALSSTGSV